MLEISEGPALTTTMLVSTALRSRLRSEAWGRNWQAACDLPVGSFSMRSKTSIPSITCPKIVYFPVDKGDSVSIYCFQSSSNSQSVVRGKVHGSHTVERWLCLECDEELAAVHIK